MNSKKHFATIAIISILLLVPLSATDINFSGSSKTSAGAYMPYTENTGDFSILNEQLQAELDVTASNSRLFVSGSMNFDALQNNKISGSLKEAWFDWISPSSESGLQFGFKLGRQINAWGKADGIRIADILCAQDLSTLSATDYSDSRLGFDGLTLSLSGNIFSVNAYVLPFFKASTLPLEPSNPLRKILIPESQGGLTVSLGELQLPEFTLENTAYAMRMSFWLPVMDFSIYGYYGFDDMPIINYSLLFESGFPRGIQVSGNYYKYEMLGLDTAIPLGNFVLRLEAASFFDKAVNNKAEYILEGGNTYTRKNQLMALAGLDFIYGDWTITAQYYEDILFNHDDNCDREFREPGATLSISTSLLSQTLELSLTGAVLFNDFDSAINFDIKYSLSDEITLNLEATEYLSGPDNKGTYGNYHDLSSIVISGIYKF